MLLFCWTYQTVSTAASAATSAFLRWMGSPERKSNPGFHRSLWYARHQPLTVSTRSCLFCQTFMLFTCLFLSASISSLTPAFTTAGERAEGVRTWEHGGSRYPLARLARLSLRMPRSPSVTGPLTTSSKICVNPPSPSSGRCHLKVKTSPEWS
jgi:hypothetical protein